MVVRTEDNQFHLFIVDNESVRPKGIAPGARVRIFSSITDEAGVQLATRVSVLEPPPTSQTGPAADMAPPPKEMRDVQREIEKKVRRWQLGVRIGAGLDPELFLIGVHTGISPIFNRDFYLRPNAEFGFGELTDMLALNLEGAYRLPISSRHGRWSSYFGAGPSFNFIHQGLERRSRMRNLNPSMRNEPPNFKFFPSRFVPGLSTAITGVFLCDVLTEGLLKYAGMFSVR
jgi:hypothetical protein